MENCKNTKVYFHRRNDDNSVFYVGIGINYRPQSKRRRNAHWHNVVNKVGRTVEIVHEGLTWDEACEYEIKYIKDFGRNDKGLGPLVNMTDGGDGTLGLTAWNKGTKGLPQMKKKEDHRKKLSISKIGTKMSEETRKKISEYNKGQKRPYVSKVCSERVGVKHPMSILTKEDVLEIRRLYSNGGIGQGTLGKKFGVSRGAIYDIVHRKNWSHI